MDASTIVWIVILLVALLLVLALVGKVASKKRRVHRHDEAARIRTEATEESNRVAEREARAEQLAARSRASQAEAEAKAAEAAALRHHAEGGRTDAASARDSLNQKFARADKLDPETSERRANGRQQDESRGDRPTR